VAGIRRLGWYDRQDESAHRRPEDLEDRAEKSIELLTRGEQELAATNEELNAAMEELSATNEEFEAQNEELIAAENELKAGEEKIPQPGRKHQRGHILDRRRGDADLHKSRDRKNDRLYRHGNSRLGFAPSYTRRMSMG
jgi:uncharacterized membrane protein YccC